MRLLLTIMRTTARKTAYVGFSLRKYLGIDGMGSTLWRLMPYLSKYKLIYIVLLLLLFADIVVTLFFTWFLSEITDAALAKQADYVRNLLILGGAMVLASLASVYYETLLECEAENRVRRDLKLGLFEHMLRLPASFYSKHHSGDLVSRLTADIDNTGGAIGVNLLNLIRMPLMALAAFIYLLSIEAKLALMCLLLGPAALLVGGVFGKRIRDNGRVLQKRLGKINGLLHDVFAGHSVVKAFAMERHIGSRYQADCDEVLSLERKEARLLGMLQAGSSTVSLASFFVSLGLGAYFVSRGEITVGALLAFVNLIQHLLYPFSGLASQWGGLQRSLASLERIWKVMDEKPQRAEFPAYIAPTPLLKGITIHNVSFSYEGRKPAIQQLDLEIPAGQTVALVGPSGAGKSTFFQLLMGFYLPDHGEIRLDDRGIRDTDPDLWRSFVSLVPQDPYLFTGTVRDNIAGGRPDAGLEEIIEAARSANAHEFIMRLPDGYDTWIGERGAALSGGQKQRITIARAILRNAPILLLDEATSSLDTETEAAVKEALGRLMKGRTTIMITHRLSALSDADRILVMESGTVVEDGTHEELIARRGRYYTLHERR